MKYEHDYTSYKVPSPVIADPQTATEDCAGDLTTTHTLMRSLMSDIEGMQALARQQKDDPGTVSPDAVNDRLEALWALAETIDMRMKDHVILLHAIIDKNNRDHDAHRLAA